MSQMHQMQVSYVSTEDRLLLRLNTKSRQEFRFWMTRRYAALLWNALIKVIDEAAKSPGKPSVAEIQDPLVKTAEQEVKHQEVVSQSDFKTEYQESTYLPLGEEPVLLFGIGLKSNEEGQPVLGMHPENGQGIEMVLNEQIVHSLCKLLADTTKKADWRLDLNFSEPTGEEGGTAGLN
ncbi:MAG: hypothetical protein AAGA96_07445 [Verrucomicrobiota bacterium]